MTRVGMAVASILVLAASLLACDSKPTTKASDTVEAPPVSVDPPRPQIVKEEGPMPAPDTVIGSAGEHRVMVAEFEKASRVSLLFAPEGVTEMPAERMAIPHIHMTLTRSLLGQKLMAEEATERSIAVRDAEIVAWLKDNEKLARFASLLDREAELAKALEPYGLTRTDLLDVARAELVKDRLTNALVAEVGVDEIWQAYEIEKTTRTLALVSMSNVPSSAEIDEFVEKRAAEIDAHFASNPAKFRIPQRARVHLVRPAPGKAVSPDVLQAAVADLERGVQPVTVARTHGLEHELDVELVKAENPRAFSDGAGSVGFEMEGPRGAYAWKVQGFAPSRLPELTRPLRREIAAEILRTSHLTPHVSEALSESGGLLATTDFEDEAAVDAIEKTIETNGQKFEILTTNHHPGGVLPGHGLAEEVLEKVFETEVGAVSPPILSRERGFAFLVLERHDASRAEFDANFDANRKAYQDAYRPRALQFWVEARLNELKASVDAAPLRVKYGVLKK